MILSLLSLCLSASFRVWSMSEQMPHSHLTDSVIICSLQHKWWFPIRDIIGNTLQWLIAFAFIIIHCCIMFLLPVPGCPKWELSFMKHSHCDTSLTVHIVFSWISRGYLGPGGIQDGGLYENCTGGAAAYIDRLIFGPNHMYGHSTCQAGFPGMLMWHLVLTILPHAFLYVKLSFSPCRELIRQVSLWTLREHLVFWPLWSFASLACRWVY